MTNDDKGDVEVVREAILNRFAGTDIEDSWRRLECFILRAAGATSIHDLARDTKAWRDAERMGSERRAREAGQ